MPEERDTRSYIHWLGNTDSDNPMCKFCKTTRLQRQTKSHFYCKSCNLRISIPDAVEEKVSIDRSVSMVDGFDPSIMFLSSARVDECAARDAKDELAKKYGKDSKIIEDDTIALLGRSGGVRILREWEH